MTAVLLNQAAFLCDELLLFFAGTFFPLRRASDKPIAMACLRFVTFFPLRPDFSRPRLNSCISRFTSLPALGLYLRREPDLRDEDDLLREVERCFVAMDGMCLLVKNSPHFEIQRVRARVGAIYTLFRRSGKVSACERLRILFC